jgi:hypothetical protein
MKVFIEINLKFHVYNNTFNMKIEEKRVGRSPQEIGTPPTYRNVLTSLRGTRSMQNGITP